MDRKLLLAFPPAAVISTIFLLIALSVFAVAAPLSESESVTVGNQSQGSAVGSEATAAPAAAAPAAATTGGGGGGGGGGAAAPAPTPTPTPAPTPEPTPAPTPAPPITTVPVTTTNVPVTETEKKQEVIRGVTPEELGITEITASNVEVTQTGAAELTVTATPTIIDSITQAIALEQGVKQVLEEIKNEISAQQAQAVSIQIKLEVFEVKSPETGKSTFVSKVSLTFTAPDTLQNVKIVQVIPKSVAQNVAEVIFGGGQPAVLQADPVVQWSFDSVAEGETKDLSYTVKKKLTSLEATTVAVASAPAVQPAPTPAPAFDTTTIIIVVVVIVVVAAVAVVAKRRSGIQNSVPSRRRK